MGEQPRFDVVAWARQVKAELSRSGWRHWTDEDTAELARRLGGQVVRTSEDGPAPGAPSSTTPAPDAATRVPDR